MKKVLRKIVALGLILYMSVSMVSCDDKAKKEEENKKTTVIEKTENTEGAIIPSQCFSGEDRSIWYYIKSETEDDVIQSVDDDAIIDTIYVFENGNVITYPLDYMEFALDNKLGDLEKLSDDEIIELLEENNQSEALKYQVKKDRDLEIYKDVVAQDKLNEEVIEYEYDEYDVLREVHSYPNGPIVKDYSQYISDLKQFDASLFNDGIYNLNVVTDDALKNTIKEELSFGYRGAKTIPVLKGMVWDYDENGELEVIYDKYTVNAVGGEAHNVDPYAKQMVEVECVASVLATGKEYTFIDAKSVMEIGTSCYGGFEVRNEYDYGITVENGWFVTRTDEDAIFELDIPGNDGVDVDGVKKSNN